MNSSELLSSQTYHGKKIEQYLTNFNKDSATRKTIDYLVKRQQLLDVEWSAFQDNHDQLMASTEIDGSHEYFSKDFFGSVKKCYEELGKRIKACSKVATAATPENAPKAGPASAASSADTNVPPAVAPIDETTNIYHQTLRNLLSKVNSNPPSSKAHANLLLNAITNHWTNISHIHHQQLTESGGLYEPTDYFNLEQEYIQVVLLLQTIIDSSTEGRPIQGFHESIRLPKINLPIFDGDYLKWKQFEELFSEMIGKQNISNAQKMMYLKSNLRGEPDKLIHHLQISENNYDTAWGILCGRYNNRRLIVSTLLDKVITHPSCGSESAIAIKTLHDTTKECLSALQNMGMPVDHWSVILHHIVIKKLDTKTHAMYEQVVANPRETQEIDHLLDFLDLRFQALETLGTKSIFREQRQSRQKTSLISSPSGQKKPSGSCEVCKGTHPLFACKQFLSLLPAERYKRVKGMNRCINCLSSAHFKSTCTARKCLKCNKAHNTLLHFDTQATSDPSTSITEDLASTSLSAITEINQDRDHTLLATAVIHVLDQHGTPVKCRALLDSGSQLNFITARVHQRLGLRYQPSNVQIGGIGNSRCNTQKRAMITIQSTINSYSAILEVFILPSIAADQPGHKLAVNKWPIPKNIKLADPEFNIPAKIDLLIGAELFCSLLAIGQIKLASHLPTLQNTLFGWIILGKASKYVPNTAFCGIATSTTDVLDTQLQRFWEIEEKQGERSSETESPCEKACEDHFKTTTRRTTSGRYIVRFPLTKEAHILGSSKETALRRFYALERRLKKNPTLKIEYTKFMDEYLKLNHMEEIDEKSITQTHYVIPHHCILKPESSSTKLRVVFDASAKTTSSYSLNDILAKGPTIQDDLFSIVTRFRTHKYVFTSDIAKMYRQIIVDQRDRNLQIIIWRSDANKVIKYYRLRTVTYGTTSAPYLATRCLHQLADDEKTLHPLAAKVAKRDFYVDDVMTGSDNLLETMKLQSQLIHLLHLGGFKLHKWCSNHPQLLKYIPRENQEVQLEFDGSIQGQIKTLGLTWIPQSDEFVFKTTWDETRDVTKRTVLSDIAHLFDPLGLVNPVIVLAKIFMQELWALKLDWDAALPMEMYSKWTHYRQELKRLNTLRVSRHMVVTTPNNIQLHAFSDASEKAYGTAVYLRSLNQKGEVMVHLICSKSRVAPTKVVTLPRLELCAAHLMIQLVKRLKNDLDLKIDKVVYWTDSQIVLSWIQAESSSYKTFVANRVAYIQRNSQVTQWRHINTKLNPADLISRGMFPKDIINSTIWFHGPTFLQDPQNVWPSEKIFSRREESEEKLVKTVLTAQYRGPHFISNINHRNNYKFLQHTVGYCLRFVNNCKRSNTDRPSTLILSSIELKQARLEIIKHIQQTAYDAELSQLTKGAPISNTSQLAGLTPFLDINGVIRVGGRLQSSHYSYNMRHPIVLPYMDEITRLIAIYFHQKNLHAGPQALLSIMRQQFWPIHGKRLVQSIVRQCVLCAKSKPRSITQLMGNLPADRVQPSRPFSHVGIDYAGPIEIHYKLRGKRPTKAYICVFICFSTKAVHMEVSSDLTTAAFIACLKRFISRRGKPIRIYSDNATNFVGARNELKELRELMFSPAHQATVMEHCAEQDIDWKFTPPRSPHFGGLWEAAVKSAKGYLRKILHNTNLTFEELSTVVAEIEAILNSRPLTPMFDNPNDLQVLTPGHFLIGQPLTAINDSPGISGSLQKIWAKTKALKYEFWKRWSREYLHELQYRNKWRKNQENLAIGSLVLLKEDKTPPLKWHMARVVKLHAGSDKRIRVVEVKTANGILKRAIHNVCPLPISSASESSLDSQPPVQPQAVEPPKRRQPPASRKSKRTRINPISKALLLCLIIYSMINTSCSHRLNEFISVTPFQHSPGIYFEPAGRLSLTNDNWNIIAYFDLTTYWQEEAILQNLTDKLSNGCGAAFKLTFEPQSCVARMTQLKYQLETIMQKNKLIQPTRSSRARRGLFNAIGVTAHELFGVLDHRDAEHFDKQIDLLKSNENHLLDLLKNQTSIQEATVNIIKNDVKVVA